MSQSHRYVFILWADQFEEMAAAIFMSNVGQAGLRVKLVGLTRQPVSGSHGLAIIPDLTLDQAISLADQAACLIIPQGSASLQNLKNDPRLRKFFSLLGKNGAGFVVGPLKGVDLGQLELIPASVVNRVMLYPEGEAMWKFAHKLAEVVGRLNADYPPDFSFGTEH